jgi:hypothetical protein
MCINVWLDPNSRGYRDLSFIEDLLSVLVFQRTLILALAPRARPHPH